MTATPNHAGRISWSRPVPRAVSAPPRHELLVTLLRVYADVVLEPARVARRKKVPAIAEQLEAAHGVIRELAGYAAAGADVSAALEVQLGVLRELGDRFRVLGMHWCKLQVAGAVRDIVMLYELKVA